MLVVTLQTGSESSVDRLMKQITSFMSEISDEFKVVVVGAIAALCQKYPRKHAVMMNYLSSMLRDEVGQSCFNACHQSIVFLLTGRLRLQTIHCWMHYYYNRRVSRIKRVRSWTFVRVYWGKKGKHLASNRS